MSHYRQYRYKGIIKPDFADDIGKVTAAGGDWRAAESKELKELFEAWEAEEYYFDGWKLNNMTSVDDKAVFEKESRLLVYDRYFSRGCFEDMAVFARCLLPAITERVISFIVWDEFEDDNGDYEHDLTAQVEEDMKAPPAPGNIQFCINGWDYYYSSI